MLVLTRRSDEGLLIADNIQVRVLSIENGRVRLGISAPRSVPVMRSELEPEWTAAADSQQLRRDARRETRAPERAVIV